MSNKTLFYLMSIVIVGMVALLAMNLIGVLDLTPQENGISRNDVRGIDYEHDGKLWTLNFDQQNRLITIINDSNETPQQSLDKIIIYKFNGPEIVINSVNEPMQKLLSETYDVKTTPNQ